MTVARYSFEGEKFEILVRPDPALDYKLGRGKGGGGDLSKVLVSDEIYSDSGKGTKPPAEKLARAFGTTDAAAAARIILEKGEINMTTEQRRRLVEEKRKQVVESIAKSFVDPRSHLPHPPLRIERAMKDARVSIDPQRGAQDQVKDVVEKIRGVIPLRSENLELVVVVPPQYAAQSYSALKSAGTIKSEEWLPNGSLKAILEIPAAARPRVIDRLGSVTKGTATAEVRR